ncbi:unnamed protein product [Paramecium octaurelia]|uniref:Uncharacterized protein n=1 Tax=Paramecium octaurelia TaxID=43137 RepID=A0A8S1SZ57_PAROT|nr:unnamed protein product [Paramecium octaurelia]
MGAVQICIKQRNSDQQTEYYIPTIQKRKQLIKHSHKQNTLIPPLSQLGEEYESLELLELSLQENSINLSINKTATLNCGCTNPQSIQFNPNLNLSLNSIIPNQQTNHNLPFLDFFEQKEQEIMQKKQAYKDSQFKIFAHKQGEKKGGHAQSINSNSIGQRAKNINNEDSPVLIQRDSETNTKKSILKNKKQILTNQLQRGVSLRQQQQIINNDTQSQRTSKSQKRVKFDPKIFRPKNSHFFQ